MSFDLRPVFDREALKHRRKELEEIFDRPEFKEFERKMRAQAEAEAHHAMIEHKRRARMRADIHADLEALESRMMITTAAERAEFFKYGRSPVQAWLDDAGFPWPKPDVLQIDKDYAKYCADLDNRPNFLSWCIGQVRINKTTNLGATKL